MPDNNGAMLEDLPLHSLAERNGFKKGDVIIKMDNQDINSISDLLQVYQNIKWMGSVECIIVRNQSEMKIKISFKD
ncbi:MAG TPA: PDZ domain-containing protein [Ginsengibacter sp.]